VVDTVSSVQLNYINGSEDQAAKGFAASAGLGIRWNQVVLDVAYDYSTYQRASRVQTPREGELATFHRQKQHRLFVGFTGYFSRL
jgi:opacity protein-like surface antigen